MSEYTSWNIEQVWGSNRFYHEGDVAKDMVAFVIDSGVSKETNDLNLNLEWSKSFVPSTSDPWSDATGHGTAVASVIGASANYEGLTGVAPGAQIVSLKVFGDSGWTSASYVNRALMHARDVIVENNLFDKAVINLSLGRRGAYSHPLVKELADLGIKFAISAGNEWSDVDDFSPASYGDHENVYTVSSSTQLGTYSRFTNWDNDDGVDNIDFSAPGSAIPTYNQDGTIGYSNGTSFSAPHIAGVLLMSDSIKVGQTFELTDYQKESGMVPDPLGMFDPTTYKHVSRPDPIIIEVPVPGPVVEVPGPVVEIPVYIEVPGPVVEVPVYPPQTTFVGKLNERNRIKGSNLDDVIIGGNDKDVLRGKGGDDYIISNGGKDKVFGGEGSDTFVLSLGKGYTIIRDFDPAVDIISVPSDDLDFVATGSRTKLYCDGDLVAKINGTLDTIV